MPFISCDVQTCGYNKDKRCSLSGVLISGDGAKKPSATSCESYVEQYALGQSIDSPPPSAAVNCQAKNCIHNSTGVCNAGIIDVCGNKAKTVSDTKCDTFTT